MAEFKVPVKIDGFKCVEDMVKAVLNYTYKGKTLQEWADSISRPITNADRIRKWSDEEIAEFTIGVADGVFELFTGAKMPDEKRRVMKAEWLDWLKQEAQCTSG